MRLHYNALAESLFSQTTSFHKTVSEMIRTIRTDSSNPDFNTLVKHLDAYLAIVDGNDHTFYAQFNKTHNIKHVVIAFDNGEAVGCGAIKPYAPDTAEIKRMYTSPEHRGKGIARQVLTELENWARELSYTRCILETGKRQQEAVALYEKHGYRLIPSYGQYENVENSVCFEKVIG